MWSWLGINLALLLISYLLGSFPTGYLLGRWLKGIDIREQGSGSTGATNVLRILGKGPGATVFFVDVLKGTLGIALLRWVYTQPWLPQPPREMGDITTWLPWMVIGCALAALLGHSKSIWLNFTGGKSVATGLGILLMLDWRMALATLGVFALVLAAGRWVSLSSVVAAMTVPLGLFLLGQPLPYLLLGMVGSLYVIGRHQSNLKRLLAGTEPRLGAKAIPEVASPETSDMPSKTTG
jgi:acyl phosphate:glycerol-3-phosphate acyltransferase